MSSQNPSTLRDDGGLSGGLSSNHIDGDDDKLVLSTPTYLLQPCRPSYAALIAPPSCATLTLD